MKKKIILRGAIGFPIGIAIGYVISILTSLALGEGYYAPCVPELITTMGSEINAVILQAALCGLLGVGFSAGSLIWEIDHWGLAKQTGVYFIIVSLIMMPVAYFTYWMEHSMKGFFGYFGIFALIFILVWVVELFIGKYNVKKLNENLHKAK